MVEGVDVGGVLRSPCGFGGGNVTFLFGIKIVRGEIFFRSKGEDGNLTIIDCGRNEALWCE